MSVSTVFIRTGYPGHSVVVNEPQYDLNHYKQ